MATLLANLNTIVQAVLGWLGTVCDTITVTPLLILTTGFLVLGGTIGILGRCCSRS